MSVIAAIGLMVVGTQDIDVLLKGVQNVSADDLAFLKDNASTITASGGAVLVVGLLELIASVGIFGHRGWGRWLGVLLGLLGILSGIAAIVASNGEPIVVNGSTIDLSQNTSPSAGFVVFYAIVFLGLLFGGGHFRLRQAGKQQ